MTSPTTRLSVATLTCIHPRRRNRLRVEAVAFQLRRAGHRTAGGSVRGVWSRLSVTTLTGVLSPNYLSYSRGAAIRLGAA